MKKELKQEEIDSAINFFKKYKILFAACWSNALHPIDLKNYFEGRIWRIENHTDMTAC